MALSCQAKLTGSYIFISGNSTFYKCQVSMENITVGKNKRRNLFAEMTKAGEVLVQDGHLSISHIQRYLTCCYTYATKMMDYLVNIGKLHQSDPGIFLSVRLSPCSGEQDISPSDKRNIAQVFKSAKSGDTR
jgi:hypothetical protein